MTSFDELLLIGQKYETKALKRILSNFNVSLVERNSDCKYDFTVKTKTGQVISFEVKADIQSNKTHNYFVEYKQTQIFSGILTTCADYYIFTNGSKYYCISTDKLKNLIIAQKYIKIIDQQYYSGYIFPVNVINECAYQLKRHPPSASAKKLEITDILSDI